MENELYHYGRKGMKWYQNIFTKHKERKAKRQAAAEEKRKETVEEQKTRIRNSRSAKQVYENAHLFNDKELTEIYNRLNTENNIKNLIPAKVNKGKKFAENASSTLKTVGDATKNFNNVITQFQNLGKLFGGKKDTSGSTSGSKTDDKGSGKTKDSKSKSDSKVERVTNFEILDQASKSTSSRQASKPRDIIDYGDYEGGRPSYDATKLAQTLVRNAGSRTVSAVKNNADTLSSVDDYLLSIGVRRVNP